MAKTMTANTFDQVLEGIEEAKRGNTPLGLQLLQNAAKTPHFPEAKAWHGYCLAREKNLFREGISLCEDALSHKPDSSDIYLALGRIYLLSGHRGSAIRTLQKGLKLDNNRQISRLLESIGMRKPPVFGFLSRRSKFNIASGRLLSWIGMR